MATYQKATSEKATQEDNQILRQVLEEVNLFIKDYGKKKGFGSSLRPPTMETSLTPKKVLISQMKFWKV
ncbi:MAG: hypothetical protein IPK96_11270 [Flammeovirgaceae bacterium]|nr:hypothetical protein [Flammeovirgaceae bacterium]